MQCDNYHCYQVVRVPARTLAETDVVVIAKTSVSTFTPVAMQLSAPQ